MTPRELSLLVSDSEAGWKVRYVLDFGIVRKMVFDEERAMQWLGTHCSIERTHKNALHSPNLLRTTTGVCVTPGAHRRPADNVRRPACGMQLYIFYTVMYSNV